MFEDMRTIALQPHRFLWCVMQLLTNPNKVVIISQQAAILEILFVAAGFLKTPLASIVMQLLARNTVILFTIQVGACVPICSA